jgi:hypothetical protein
VVGAGRSGTGGYSLMSGLDAYDIHLYIFIRDMHVR